MWNGLSHGSTPLAPHVFATGTLTAAAKARSPSMLRVPTTPGPASTTMRPSGRWPQVVNMWECVDGWSGWRRLMEATNLRRTTNPELNEWWQEALKSRSGGFDRLLGAAPGCPSLADLRAGAVSGSVFVHEISEGQPGAALDYLAAVRRTPSPPLAPPGHQRGGPDQGPMTHREVPP